MDPSVAISIYLYPALPEPEISGVTRGPRGASQHGTRGGGPYTLYDA